MQADALLPEPPGKPTDDETSRLMVKQFSTVRDTQRFTELHGEEKGEEGVRSDPNEMRWNQKRREQTSQ